MNLHHYSVIQYLTHISGLQPKIPEGEHEENNNRATQESNNDTNKTAMIRKFSECTKLIFTEK